VAVIPRIYKAHDIGTSQTTQTTQTTHDFMSVSFHRRGDTCEVIRPLIKATRLEPDVLCLF